MSVSAIKNRNRKKIKKKFCLQQDQSDCGMACLRNILGFYEAEISLEKLREWSGTGSQGTSLLGLQQAATRAGFTAVGMQAEKLANLQEVSHPCILAVIVNEQSLHYIVYYPVADDWERGRYLIGDPARGVLEISALELDGIWASKALLMMKPGDRITKWQKPQQKKMRWLWDTLREDVHFLLIAMILGMGASALNLSTAIFSQKLVDTILPGKHREQLLAGLVLLGIVFGIRSLLGYLRQSLLNRQGFQFNTRLTGGFYRSILYLNKSFFDNRKTGDLIARLTDTLRIQQATAYILGEMSIQFLMLVVTLGLLFFYSWSLGLCCLVMIPAVYGVVNYFENDIVANQRDSMIGYARSESNYVDTIRGIHTIKAMNKEAFFTGLAKTIFGSFQESVWKLAQRKVRFTVCLEILTSLFLLMILTWSALDVLNGSLRTGQMIAILQLAGLLMQSTVAVALTNLQVQEANVAMDRMYEFTTIDPEYDLAENKLPAAAGSPEVLGMPAGIVGKIPPACEHLTIKNLLFRFPGRKPLLQGLSLGVHRGQIVAIAGESGQGKSTLFQVLQKFYSYEGGHVWVDGRELSGIPTPEWRRLIGVVPQEIVLFSGNLLANIALDTDPVHIPRLEAFCRRYGFDRYFERLPQSYNTMLGEGGIALSGGQKQLLALARCLYAEPQLLLLDEPTSAMDGGTEEFVIGILQKIRKEKAILVISHKDSLTGIADETYWLKGGSCARLPVVIAMEEVHPG